MWLVLHDIATCPLRPVFLQMLPPHPKRNHVFRASCTRSPPATLVHERTSRAQRLQQTSKPEDVDRGDLVFCVRRMSGVRRCPGVANISRELMS